MIKDGVVTGAVRAALRRRDTQTLPLCSSAAEGKVDSRHDATETDDERRRSLARPLGRGGINKLVKLSPLKRRNGT